MKREFKIGIFAVLMIVAAWAGIKFLSGFDIFSSHNVYYAAYTQVNGIQNASAIMMQGVKIGSVTDISFDPQKSDKVVLQLTIKSRYAIPADSEAKIFSSGLMGSKAIEIGYGKSGAFLSEGDTLKSSYTPDLMDVASSELEFFKRELSQVTGELTVTLQSINGLLAQNSDNITQTLDNVNSMSGDMSALLASQRENLEQSIASLSKFSAMLGENSERIDSIVGDVEMMTNDLSEAKVAQSLGGVLARTDSLLMAINSQQGTMGELVYNPELYNSLNEATANLSALLENLKQHPERYVHLSVFGRDPYKMQERAEEREAKAQAKAERDSLKRLK